MSGWIDREGLVRTSKVPHLPPLTPNSRHAPNREIVSREIVPHREERGGGGKWLQNQELGNMEKRISALEMSHQLFLEELVRMQSASKTLALRQHQDEWKEQRDIMERSLRDSYDANSSLANRLEQRIAENERRGADDVKKLNHSFGEFQAVIDQQQIEERERMRKMVLRVEEDLDHLAKQQMHLEAVIGRQGARVEGGVDKMEELLEQHQETNVALSRLRKAVQNLETGHHSLSNTVGQMDGVTGELVTQEHHLSRMVDTRTGELWAAIAELRNSLDAREMEGKHQDKWLKQSFSQLQKNLEDLAGKVASSAENSSVTMKVLHERGEEDARQLHKYVMSELEQQWERWEKKRAESRGDIEQKLTHLEEEIKKRLGNGDKQQVVLEDQTEQLKRMLKDIEQAKRQVHQGMSALQKSMSQLESEGLLTKQDLTRVLTAEIKTRRQEVLEIQSQCSEVQDIVHVSIASLRESLTLLENRVQHETKKFQGMLMALQQDMARENGERLESLEIRLSTFEDRFVEQNTTQQQLAEWQRNIVNQLHTLEERIELGLEAQSKLSSRPPVTRSTTQLETQLMENAAQLHTLAASFTELKTKLSGDIEKKTNQWYRDMLELRNELASLHRSLFVSPTPHLNTTQQQRPRASWPHPHSNLFPQETNAVTLHSDQPTSIQPDYRLPHQENAGASYPDTQYPLDRTGSPTPEPHSGHSSPKNGYRPRRSRRGRVRHRQQQPAIIATEPTETQGTFTSAAPTPLDMRRILIDNQQEDDEYHDMEAQNDIIAQIETEEMNRGAQDDTQTSSDNQQREVKDPTAYQNTRSVLDSPHGETDSRERTTQNNMENSRSDSQQEEAELDFLADQAEDVGHSQPHSHRASNEMRANSDNEQDEVDTSDPTKDTVASRPQPLLKKRSSSHFIKSYDEDDDESEQTGPISWMNEWGIYQALRLAQIKQRLMRPVERLRQLRMQEPVMEEEEEQWSPNTEDQVDGEEQWTAEEWEGEVNDADELESEEELNEDEFLEEGMIQSDSEPDYQSTELMDGQNDEDSSLGVRDS